MRTALALVLSLIACSGPRSEVRQAVGPARAHSAAIRVAHLDPLEGARGLEQLRADLRTEHPDYDLAFAPALERWVAVERPCVIFVQVGQATGRVGDSESELRVGDLVLLRRGETLECEGELSGVVFELPPPLPADLPAFVRVDYDPQITDTPGGCATDPGAYRRIALTWLASRGPYVLHGLNAHRVRIDDSFTHYHPREHGFSELYLVQEAPPGARLLTSSRLPLLTDPAAADPATLTGLFEEHPLVAGDLVYIPRGVAHRGLGGAVVHVLAIPGFRPGAEIGLDHLLRELNDVHGLEGERALPLHDAGAREALVR